MNYNKNRVFAILCETMQIVVKLLRFHVVSDRNNFGLLERLPVLGFIFIFWAHLICIMIKKIITHPPS